MVVYQHGGGAEEKTIVIVDFETNLQRTYPSIITCLLRKVKLLLRVEASRDDVGQRAWDLHMAGKKGVKRLNLRKFSLIYLYKQNPILGLTTHFNSNYCLTTLLQQLHYLEAIKLQKRESLTHASRNYISFPGKT